MKVNLIYLRNRIVFAVACPLLQSCKGDFSTRESKQSTIFYLLPEGEIRGEFVGLIGDSVIIVPSDRTSVMRSMHIREIESVRFKNVASAGGNALLGLLAGAGLGFGGGLVILASNEPHGGVGAAPILLGGLGGLIGIVAGAFSASDKIIWMEDLHAIEDLTEHTDHKTESAVRNARGY